MSKSLGIYVTSDKHMDKLIKLCQAAKKKNVEVSVFFTHLGTLLSMDQRLKELQGLAARIALCNVGFESNNLQRSESIFDDKAYASQSWHAEMLHDCDRYLTF